jgi:hypothetical protein
MLNTARRTIVYILVPMLVLLFMPVPGSSSDAKGNYVALGFGLESCGAFIQASAHGLDITYRHWLAGYLTAVNKLTKDTVDMRGTTDIDRMILSLKNYCASHRAKSFSAAAEVLITELYPKRMTQMPKKQE